MTVASLPMYDLPEIEAATDAWWHGLARAFRREGIGDVPNSLWRGEDYRSLWTRPDLLISQTCGYPLIHELRGSVTLVATPCYSAPGCEGTSYCSVVVVRRDSSAGDVSALRGARWAVNSYDSQSGYNALRALIAPFAAGQQFFRDVVISGSHLNSLRMVSEGEADVAAIDCVTHALLKRHRPRAVGKTRMLCFTPSVPALPFITHYAAKDDLLRGLRNGLAAACHDPELSVIRKILMLRDIRLLPLSAYDRIAEMEEKAIGSGYRKVV